ncbi:hypothetical protein [Streptomyces sp. CG 926]|nr:hypothetical protein [Streptomyces sp. CG 926]
MNADPQSARADRSPLRASTVAATVLLPVVHAVAALVVIALTRMVLAPRP